MIDYYLKNKDKAEFDQAMIECGIYIPLREYHYNEHDSADNVILSSRDTLIDIIGPITVVKDYDVEGNPIFDIYPEYHSNIRILNNSLTTEQIAMLELYRVTPSTLYRTWA